MRAEDDQGTPTQRHISHCMLVYEDKHAFRHFGERGGLGGRRAGGEHSTPDSSTSSLVRQLEPLTT